MVKSFEQEIKKIKNEIGDQIENFDKKLQTFFLMRLEYNFRIIEQELLISNFQNNIQSSEYNEEELERL